MRAILVLAFAGLAACPKPPPKPVLPPDLPTDITQCSPAATLTEDGVCNDYFTDDGFACARCSNVTACLDTTLMMYCTAGPCANDPLCKYVANPLLPSKSRKGR